MLVVAIILALAFVARRFNVTQAGNGQLKVVASMSAGAKEKIMVIDVAGEQFLLGVTAHNINQLGKLDNPIVSKSTSVGGDNNSLTTGDNSQLAFKDKLVQAMAQAMVGSKSTTKAGSQGQSNEA
jgi:flagellar protein FliO/FliZ